MPPTQHTARYCPPGRLGELTTLEHFTFAPSGNFLISIFAPGGIGALSNRGPWPIQYSGQNNAHLEKHQ